MEEPIRTLKVGATGINIINIGDVQEDLRQWFGLSEAELAANPLFEQPARLPIQSIYIAAPGMSVLVDAGLYDYPPDAPQLIPGYQPPPDLFAQLAAINVDPATINHVIITHAHGDHFNALTETHEGQAQIKFPNARHYVGRADWEAAQKALTDPNSLESRTLGVLHQQGLLELVEHPRDLGSGIQIIPAPGESPGHQIVRVYSEGETLYCLGDLYHLVAEVENPKWVLRWTNGEANQRSRQAFNEQALKEDARLVATHIAPVGRLARTATGYTWVAV